jgi:cytochrome P450
MMEATLLLATIAQHFQFCGVPGYPVTPTPSFTLRPKHGIRMGFESRRHTAKNNGGLVKGEVVNL